MKDFFILLFLFLLFGSSQESTLSDKKLIRGLNTTLQTNFNGTYQRKNPCTNADIETSSYIASHEFHHHAKEKNNWSNFTDKCSAIINSFLQAVGSLIRFNSKQNGVFNFQINTSISQKQDDHCMPGDKKHFNSLPTITIEAKSCELPLPCRSSLDTENNEREKAIVQEIKCFPDENNKIAKKTVVKTISSKRKPTKFISETLATLKPVNGNSATLQPLTEDEINSLPLQDVTSKYQSHTISEGVTLEEKLKKEQKLILVIDGSENKNISPKTGFSETSSPAGIRETEDSSQAFFNDYSQSTQTTHKPEQNFDVIRATRPTTDTDLESRLCFTTPTTNIPEDKFTIPYGDIKSSIEALSSEANQSSTFGFEKSPDYLTSPGTSATRQENFTDRKFTTPETQNTLYYSPPMTELELGTTPQQNFVKNEKSVSNEYQPFNVGFGETVSDFQLSKRLSNTQPSSTTTVLPSTLESEFSPFEKPFNYQQRVSVGVEEEKVESLKPDFNINYIEKITPTSAERFQPAELLPDQKMNLFRPQVSQPNEIPEFVTEEDRFSLQERPQFPKIFDKTSTVPYATTIKLDQRNEKTSEIVNTDSPNLKDMLSGTTQPVRFPTSTNQLEASSYPPQVPPFEDFGESNPNILRIENTSPDARQTKNPNFSASRQIPPLKTSTILPDYGFDESLIPTTPAVYYSDQVPTTPSPFYDNTPDQNLESPEITHPGNLDQETPYTDSVYDDLPVDSFSPMEENYNKSPSSSLPPERLVNSFTDRPSFSEPLPDYYNENSDKHMDEPIPNLDQLRRKTPDVINPSMDQISNSNPPVTPPFDLTTTYYNQPELSTTRATLNIPASDLLIGKDFIPSTIKLSEAEQHSVPLKTVQRPQTNYGEKYAEDTTPAMSFSRPKFYANENEDVQPEPEYTEQSPFQFPLTTHPHKQISLEESSLPEYLTTPYPPIQTTPLPTLVSDNNQIQNFYNPPVPFFNNFKSEPQSSIKDQTPLILQQNRNLNAQKTSDEDSISPSLDPFFPKSKQTTVAYSKQENFPKAEPDRNLAFGYPDQVMKVPVPDTPTSYSGQITTDDYTISDNYQDSSFSEPKIQSFEDIHTPITKPFPLPEQFPESQIKYSTDLVPDSGFDSNPEVNPMERFPFSPDAPLVSTKPSTSELSTKSDFPSLAAKPVTNKKLSPEFSNENSLLDKQNNRFTTPIPNLESFTIYDTQYPREEPLLNTETNPDYKSSTIIEKLSSDNYKKSDFQPMRIKPDRYSTDKVIPERESFLETQTTPFFEPQYQPNVSPRIENPNFFNSETYPPEDQQPRETFDEALISTYKNPSTGFLTTIQPPQTLGFTDSSKTQTQSFLSDSDVQPDSDLKLQADLSTEEPNQPKSNLPFWADHSPEFTKLTLDNQPLPIFEAITNPVGGDIVTDPPNSEFTQPLFSETKKFKTLKQKDSFDSFLPPQADLKPDNMLDQTELNRMTEATDYPSELEPLTDYYNEESPNNSLKKEALVPADITFVPQQSKDMTQEKYVQTTSETNLYSSSAEETDVPMNYSEVPLESEIISSPIPQVNSYSNPQYMRKKMPVHLPSFVSEPQQSQPQPQSPTQPQPLYDNFSDIPGDKPIDNTLPPTSMKNVDNIKSTTQYPATFSETQHVDERTVSTDLNLDIQRQSNFRESPFPNFDTPRTTVAYSSDSQPSRAFDNTLKTLLVTDIPTYQTLPDSDLKREKFITKSDQRSLENTGPRETLVHADNVLPQPQATTAVKYDEEIQTTQYQTSPAPSPQPQTALNYANQFSIDSPNGKLPEFFTNQQHLVTPDFIPKAEPTSSQTSSLQTPNTDASPEPFFQSENKMTEDQLAATYPSENTYQTKTKETFEQEIITSDYPAAVTPQTQMELPPITSKSESKEIFLPYHNQFHSQPLNPNNQLSEYQETFSRERESRINPSISSPQNYNEFQKTIIPSQLPGRELDSEKEQMDLTEVNRSKTFGNSFLINKHPESFWRMSDDISNARASQGMEPKPLLEHSNQFANYNGISRSNKLVPNFSNVDPQHRTLYQSPPSKTQVSLERFSDSHKSQNVNPRLPSLDTLSIIQTADSHGKIQNEPQTNPQRLSSSFASSSNNAKGSTTVKVLEEIITTDVPTAVTASPIQEQLAYADRLLNNNKKLPEFQPLTGPAQENYDKRVEHSENLDRRSYGPPITGYERRPFSRHPINTQQVEPFFEKGFPPNVSYPDYPLEEPRMGHQGPFFSERDYGDYDRVFYNRPSNQRFAYDQAMPRHSQEVEKVLMRRKELRNREDADLIEKQSHGFQTGYLRSPAIYTPHSDPSAYQPRPIEKEEHSNPLFQTLGSHMTLPFQKPSSETLNNSFPPQPDDQIKSQDTSSDSSRWEHHNSQQTYTGFNSAQNIKKQPQPESHPVHTDLTNPSNNPGEDCVSKCRLHNRGAALRPVLCPFDPILKGNMTIPSYYILISKRSVDDNGDEQFQVEKVYLGDGTPLNCSFDSGKTFSTSLYTPVPYSAANIVKLHTKSDIA